MAQKPTYEELEQRIKELEQANFEHKKAEDVLQDEHKRYNILFHDLADPVFIFRDNEPNIFLDCNMAAVEKYGYSREEILKMAPQDLHPPDELGIVKKNIKDDKVIPHEYIHIGKDGKSFFVNIHSRKIEYNGEDAQISVIRDITERKRTEEALRNSEDRLTNIIEFLPDATFVIDQNKRVIAWNRALEIMTDILKEDILGKGGTTYAMAFYEEPRPTLADLVEKEDIDIKLYDSIEREKNSLVAETFAQKLFNGKGAYVWIIASPFYDKNGNFLGAIESIRDITEQKKTETELIKHRNHLEELIEKRTAKLKHEIIDRKQAEKKLAASERRLDAIIKTVPDIIYRLDADGRITFISDAVRQYGYRPETLLGTSIIDIVYHEDKDKVKDRMAERRTGDRKTSSFEVRLMTKDQKNVLFEIFSVSAEGLYSSESTSQSSFLGTQGIARDITERKQAEKALHENEKKYRTLFDSSADAISILNLDTGKFIDCNDAAVKLHDTGNRENFLGLTPNQLSPEFQPNGELSSKLSAEYIQTALKEGAKAFEWTHCKSDGTPFPVIVTLSAMVLDEKKFVLAFGKDITDRKQAEEGWEKLIIELKDTLEKVKTLSGLVPICANCKKIRDDKGYWNQIESYIEKHSDAAFSHGICPECSEELYGKQEWYIKAKKKRLEDKS